MKKAALLRPLLSWFLVRMPSPKPRQPRPDASDFCASLSESIFNRSIFSVRFHRFDAAFRTFFVRKPQFSTLFCQKPAFYLTVFSLANCLFFPAVQGFCPFL